MPKLSTVTHMGQAVKDALARGAPDVELDTLPKSMDLSAEKITDHVQVINSNAPNARQKYINEALVKHLHSFIREVGLTTEEWMTAIEFLTKTGQKCTDLRQEFILLSDVLGVSALVDVLNHPKPEGASESTILGPFFVEDAQEIPSDKAITEEGNGKNLLIRGKVKDMKGKGIPNCLIETWEVNNEGYYDTQYENYQENCRGKLHSDAEGNYNLRGIVPVSYPIPSDGPVGELLFSIGRHIFRPAHVHMMLQVEGYDELVTALYFRGDVFLTSDAVFGVKSSLILDPKVVEDEEEVKKLGFKTGPVYLVERDFVLLTTEEADAERKKVRDGATNGTL